MFTGATDTCHEDVEDQPHNQDWGRLVASWCGIEKIRTNFYRSCFRSFVSRRSDARILFSVADAQRIASSSPGCAAWFSASMTCCSIRASILSNWLRCSVIVSSNPNFTCAWCPLQPISENQSHRMPRNCAGGSGRWLIRPFLVAAKTQAIFIHAPRTRLCTDRITWLCLCRCFGNCRDCSNSTSSSVSPRLDAIRRCFSCRRVRFNCLAALARPRGGLFHAR